MRQRPLTPRQGPHRGRRPWIGRSIAALSLSLAVAWCGASEALASPVAGHPGQRKGTDHREPPTTIHVAYFDGAGLDSAVRRAMAREVERLLATADVAVVEIDVDDLTENAGRVVPHPESLLRVIVFGRSPMSVGLRPGIMGAVFPGSRPVNAIYVFRPAVLRGLGFRDGGQPRLAPDDIGRALGRVVVHELGHALAPELRHRGFGIMGSAPRREALLRPYGRLDARFVAALRAGAERRLLPLGSKDR